MKTEIEWLDDALATKDMVATRTHYRVRDGMMTATDGRMVAGYPTRTEGEFLVPGEELGKILKRLPNEPTVKIESDKLTLRSGRFSGTLQMLPQSEWVFFDLESDIQWQLFPVELIAIMRDLRPFVAENNIHRWSLGIAIDHGWCYASNNIVLIGAPFNAGRDMQALIPAWVADFVLARTEGLQEWAVTSNYMAFRWANGAWMRSTLIDDQFPDRAGSMIREAPLGDHPISLEYRTAVMRIAELSDDAVSVYADRVEGRTLRTVVVEQLVNTPPANAPCSIWGAKHLGELMAIAKTWSPSLWPKPVPFTGERVRGYIAGRTG